DGHVTGVQTCALPISRLVNFMAQSYECGTQNAEFRIENDNQMLRSFLNSSFCVLRSAFAFLLLSCTQPPAPTLTPAQPPPPPEDIGSASCKASLSNPV